MTADLRQALREAIDRSVRAKLPEPEKACSGCGSPHADPWSERPIYLDDCTVCSERKYRRAKRRQARDAHIALLLGEEVCS